MIQKNLRRLLLLFSLLLLNMGTAQAQSSEASAWLEGNHADVRRLLQTGGRSARARASQDAEIQRILSGMIDFRELGRRALGDAWEEQSAEQRDEFVRLLSQLMQRSYREGLETTLRYEISLAGESTDDGEQIVETSAQNRENRREPAISIAYRIYRNEGRFQVVDVVTDGVSMLRNYRRQFRRILRREGWDGLMNRMRERSAEEN